MVHGFACSFGYADIFHHILALPGGSEGTNHERDQEIDQHPQKTDAFGEICQPIVLAFAQELEIDNVTESEDQSRRSFPQSLLPGSFFFEKIPRIESGEKGGCRQPKGKGHSFCDKARRWIDPKICGDCQGSEGGDSGIANFLSIGDVWFDDFLHQVMRDRSGENEEQTGSGGWGRGHTVPAMTKAMTHLGKPAISGLARTMISLS